MYSTVYGTFGSYHEHRLFLMYVDEGLKKHLSEKRTSPAHQRAKSHLYHTYLSFLIQFLVPEGKRARIVDESFESFSQANAYEYIVLPDVLGYADDIEVFLTEVRRALTVEGRVVITQHNSLWEPLLRLASLIGLRSPSKEQNWLSPHDLRNFLYLTGFEVIREGNKMLMPISLPLISSFCNTVLANIWPFSRLGLIQYMVARPTPIPTQTSPSLSIIVPARNEAGTIERIVRELPELGSFTELIFIEGHSKDNTLAEIQRVTEQYKNTKRISYAVQEGRGKGDAVRKGFSMATGDILAIYDADMTVPPGDMEKFYRAISNNYGEFINGSRLVYPVEKGAMRVLNFFGNKFFSLAFTAILGQPLKDTLCGTKVLWKKEYENIRKNRAFFGDFDPFGDFDLLFGAAKLNLKIVEVPIRYKERVYGETNISRWKHGWLLLQMTAFAARKLTFW